MFNVAGLRFNTAQDISFRIVKRGLVDLAVGADWTPATGDVKISYNDGSGWTAPVNTTNLPVAVSGVPLWNLALIASESQHKAISISIIDSPTKAIEDQGLDFYTYGDASAAVPRDLTAAEQKADVVKWNAIAIAAPDTAGFPKVTIKSGTGTGELSLTAGAVTVGTIAAAAIQSIWDALTSALTTAGSVGKLIADNLVSIASATTAIKAVTDQFTIAGGKVAAQILLAGDLAQAAADKVWLTSSRSLTVAVDILQTAADKVWSTGSRTLTGFGSLIADIWNSIASSFNTAGTMGAKLNAAGAAGDPWATALPGIYGAGTAGYILGNTGAAADPWNTTLPGGYGVGTAGRILGALGTDIPGIERNTAFPNFDFVLLGVDGLPKPGVNPVTAQRRIDGGSFALCANSVSEIGDGIYTINLAASDNNGAKITYKFSGPDARLRIFTIYTTPKPSGA